MSNQPPSLPPSPGSDPNPEQTSPEDPTPPAAPSGSETLSPNDHLKLLVELMRPGSIELARRWVSALMLVPESQRESIVEAVEAQIVEDYCP